MHGGFVLIVTVFYKKICVFVTVIIVLINEIVNKKTFFYLKKNISPSKKIVFKNKTRKRKKLSIEKNNITFF